MTEPQQVSDIDTAADMGSTTEARNLSRGATATAATAPLAGSGHSNPGRVSAAAIAEALGLPAPTAQQQAVIESPLEPALVVAGAGSGKTETMANRVLWLLANGHVHAGDILGLTFTRKAAGELGERIRTRIRQLADAGLLPDGYDEFDPPTVATYNSFANSMYRDHAILIGREPDGTVLGEASAWQLARTIVLACTDPRLPQLGKSVDTVTKAVLQLSHALSENVADAAAVEGLAERLIRAVAELPPGGRGAYSECDVITETVGALPLLLELAEKFSTAKAERGFVEYADQVALALQIVRRVPRVAQDLRNQHKVVLLDEYQDTSVVQTWLLAELFRGHPVMAVGDPNQSIYGWRGASAANLEDFGTQFADPAVGLHTFSLSTSWRNGREILKVANTLVQPLRAETRVTVDELQPSPVATAAPVDFVFEETLPEEAEAVATWLAARMRQPIRTGDGHRKPSAAILFRARKTQPEFIRALRRHGIPFHVLGIGGLLAEPEIADLVSALTVINDPDAGSELVRLLAGSRWRIGVRDLHALNRLATALRDRDYAYRPLDEDVRALLRDSVADGEDGSIVDALDFLAHAREEHSLFGLRPRFSETGLARLRDAGQTIARLRARSGMELLDFITVVEQELQLDIEVAANEHRVLGSANIEAFFDALNGYLAVDEGATLGGFLGWLREAEWREGLAPRPEDPEPGTVQLLTIHGSKGLEWDHVVVPRVVDDELPGKPIGGTRAWITLGELPYEFRGDAAELPVFAWDSAASRKELKDRFEEFKASIGEHIEREERRLAYVAVTRARHSLLLTGSFWATQKAARKPSKFLRPLADAGHIGALPEASEFEENPLGDDVNLFSWPMDPLGERRPAVEAAAHHVQAAIDSVTASTPASAASATGRWRRDLELLLAERDRGNELPSVTVPNRVPASRFKDYVTAPDRVLGQLRRPMPEKPYRATRLGTLFHEWVEQRYGVHGTAETLDVESWELGDDDEPPIHTGVAADPTQEAAALAALQATFERSPWAQRRPVDVEREIHLPFEDRIIVCKIDAVYREPAGDGGTRYQIVDWKTGKAPVDEQDLQDKQLQLALYRQAYAEYAGVDPETIDAVFYYVADDATIRPERIFSRAELVELWRASGLR